MSPEGAKEYRQGFTPACALSPLQGFTKSVVRYRGFTPACALSPLRGFTRSVVRYRGFTPACIPSPLRGFPSVLFTGGYTPGCILTPLRGFPSVLFTGGYTPGCTLTPLRGYFFALLMALGPSRVGVTGTMRPFLSKVRRSMQTSRWMPGSLCRKCLLMRW